MSQPVVYVGHDGREEVATRVCERSIRYWASKTGPVYIKRLVTPALVHAGLYSRRFSNKGTQKIDTGDGRPFSTAFAFTRFLVPALMQYEGWALFCDCDFLFLADVHELFRLADPRMAVQVVKRAPMAADGGVKMDGQSQIVYARKNWSSLILWNCTHPANARLTPHVVNTTPGQMLHQFCWLDETEIGDLPPEWNWLSRIDPMPEEGEPKAVHFTLGHPDLEGYEDSPYADHWRAEKDKL